MLDGYSTAEGLITLGFQPWTDYEVKTAMQMLTDPTYTNYESAIVGRYNGPDDYYWAGLGCWNHFASISKKVAGTSTELAYVGAETEIVPGQKYELKLKMTGNKLELYVDNVLKVTYIDSTFPSGGIGFRIYNSHTTFDYVSAATPTSPIPLWLPLAFIGVGAVIYLGAKK